MAVASAVILLKERDQAPRNCELIENKLKSYTLLNVFRQFLLKKWDRIEKISTRPDNVMNINPYAPKTGFAKRLKNNVMCDSSDNFLVREYTTPIV